MTDVCWYVETEDQMAAQLSQLTTFQQLMGVSDHSDPVASAVARVHAEVIERDDEDEYIVPDDLWNARPFCMLSSDPSVIRGANSNALVYQGEILMLIEITKQQIVDRLGNPVAKERDIIRYVKNQCGLIVRDLFNAWPVLNRSLELFWRSSANQISGDEPHCRYGFKFSFGPDE
ncbi:MAG: hypothetical protein R3C03_23955 [Pirellulaceae bacterium]